MADATFSRSVPEAPDPARRSDREAEIARAAELGRKRSESERTIKEKIKMTRAEEEKKAKQAADKAAQKKADEALRRKEYRSLLKTRENEIADDKSRRAKQAQLITDQQKIHDDRRKAQQGYMKDLHDTSLIKQAIEKRQNELLAEKERERTKAEYDHRTKTDQATHADTVRKEALEQESRARKAVIDTDVRTREYQLEGWKRSRLQQLDNESQRQFSVAVAGHTPSQAHQLRGTLEAQFRMKRKKLEIEWNEKKTTIEQEAARRKSEIDNDFYSRKAQSESELRRMTRMNDSELARRLEDIEQKYKELLTDNKSR